MNISDIAKKAGVSTATVSRVLNNSSSVTPKTRELVQQVIDSEGYVPSAVARSLSVRTTSTIGVIIPDIGTRSFALVRLRGISEVADAITIT
jgi:LacI family transcriptional regulator